MHTLAAFYKAAVTSGASYEQLPGVFDQSLSLDSQNRYIMPGNWEVLAHHVAGADLTAARLNAPSLRAMFLPELYPIRAAATPGTPNAPSYLHGQGPKLIQNEPLEVDVSHAVIAASAGWAAIWMAPQFVPAAQGRIQTLLFTASITAVAGSWTAGTMSPSQSLPAGEYEVVGMSCIAANTFYARLIFPGGTVFRPGCLVQAALGDFLLDDFWRFKRMGSYGRFMNTAIPNLEILGDAAGAAAPQVFLDLVKIR